MECKACYNSIVSDIHWKQCNTVSMWQYKKFPLGTFQNAMTYGLCGCSACVFVSNDIVHMMHDPSADKVLQYIQCNYDVKSKNTILLKVPADYYEWKEPENKIWEKLKHLPVEFSPYSSSYHIGDNFNSSLYVKRRDDGIYYTGLHGEWKLLLKTAVSQTPTSQQLPTTVDDISPNILQLLQDMDDISPTSQQLPTTVDDISPNILQLLQDMDDISPTMRQLLKATDDISPTIPYWLPLLEAKIAELTLLK